MARGAAAVGGVPRVARRQIWRGQGEWELGRHAAEPSTGTPTVKIPSGKVVQVGGVDGPKVALSIVTAAGFDEALVQRQVVTHAVLPVLILHKQEHKEPDAWKHDSMGI